MRTDESQLERTAEMLLSTIITSLRYFGFRVIVGGPRRTMLTKQLYLRPLEIILVLFDIYIPINSFYFCVLLKSHLLHMINRSEGNCLQPFSSTANNLWYVLTFLFQK